MDLRNKRVRFRVLDIYIPNLPEVLSELHNNDVIQGEVIDLSDSGAQKAAFAVIKVPSMTQLVIVPVERILEIAEPAD